MKKWRKTAAAVLAAVILCSALTVIPAEPGTLLPVMTASAESGSNYNASTHTLTLSGEITQDYDTDWDGYEIGEGIDLPYGVERKDVQHIVVQSDAVFPENSSCLFWGMRELENISFAKGFSSNNVTNMREMFIGCSSLTKLDLSGFDTSNVVSMQEMFENCQILKTIYVSEKWKKAKDNCFEMFQNCYNLKGGNGTTYNRLYTSGEYNRIDGLYGPGYLTAAEGVVIDSPYNIATQTLTLSGNISQRKSNNGNNLGIELPDGLNKNEVKHIIVKADAKFPDDSSHLFEDFEYLESIQFASGFSTANVTNMASMFESCSNLMELDLSCFNTSKVTNMSNMFCYCGSLNELDLRSFNTSRVTDMSGMFYRCYDLTQLNVSSFDTSNVTNMGLMFEYCEKLTELNVRNFDTSKVTTMHGMFCYCGKLTELDLSGFDTSKVTRMDYMFEECSNLTELDLSSFDTSKVTRMDHMFEACSNLNELDLSNFDTSKVTRMDYMFQESSNLTELNLSRFQTGSVTNMLRMFYACTSLERIYITSEWYRNNLENSKEMFLDCTKLKGENGTGYSSDHIDASYAQIDGSYSRPGYFSDAEKLGGATYNAGTKTLTLRGEIKQTYDSNGIADGIKLPSGVNRDDVLHIVVKSDAVFPNDCSYLFYGFTKLKDISFADGFSTSNVTDMTDMFYDCSSLTELDLSCFDTSNVLSMSNMFVNCAELQELNVSSFDTSKVTEMNGMFKGCRKLTDLDLQNFDTSNANSIGGMFRDCSNLIRLDLSSFDTSKVTYTGYMFYNCVKLERIAVSDKWKTDSITSSPAMFASCNALVGGNGTVYDVNQTDITYARIDGKNGQPGYFTEKQYATLTEETCYPVTSGGKKKVHVGFSAATPAGGTILTYGLIYYNSGTVIHTSDLTIENVGICGIETAQYWKANITDNGTGVTAVGYVVFEDQYGFRTLQYTGELGGNYQAMTNAANAVTLKRHENKALTTGGKNKVYVGFTADVKSGYTVQDYGLIYYNSGTVITTPYLKLENVGVCGIQKAKYWSANITDIGYGVAAVGFVKVKDANGYVTTLYTDELGNSYKAITDAESKVTLKRHENKPMTSGGKNKVYVGFNANVPAGYTVEDYGLIYYNSGTVITTPYLTMENIGVCGIQKAKYWSANITDNGYGVTAVGFVKVKDSNGYVTTLYTGEIGNSYKAMTDAAKNVTLTRLANKAVSSGGKNKVYLGFSANLKSGYSVEDYGLIYYNSGTVITTPYLTLENVGICGIQKAKYWSANITDNGYGVTAVGFVKVKDSKGYVTTLYTGELGAKFANLPH